MSEIIIISGSPAAGSRSDAIAAYLQKQAEKEGFTAKSISVLDFSPEVLIQGQYNHPSIGEFSETIQQAKGVIIVSPVYKAAYTGSLKALLDLLPQDGLRNKPVLPIMVGGSPAHLLALDYSLKPLLSALYATTILRGAYLIDKQVEKGNTERPILEEELEKRVLTQLEQLLAYAKQTVVS
ncbi:MAG: NADPH-dependent FMN reductase [Bacillus sp. (in: firmicutes)]